MTIQSKKKKTQKLMNFLNENNISLQIELRAILNLVENFQNINRNFFFYVNL